MTAPGLYPDVEEAAYHADRGSLSVSGAKTLLKAPALFRWQQDHPVEKAVYDFGTAVHAAVLGAGIESIYVAPYDDWKTKAAQTERKIAYEERLSPVLIHEWETACDMAEALTSHRLASRLLSDGQPEVSAYAIDEPTGILRRGRIDWLADGWIVDYKTTISAEPGSFARESARFDYAMQAAWYLDVVRQLGHDVEGFVFVAQSKEPPYLVACCELDWASEQIGRQRNRRALDLYADCLANDSWPGYGDSLHTISLPKWALNQEDFA